MCGRAGSVSQDHAEIIANSPLTEIQGFGDFPVASALLPPKFNDPLFSLVDSELSKVCLPAASSFWGSFGIIASPNTLWPCVPLSGRDNALKVLFQNISFCAQPEGLHNILIIQERSETKCVHRRIG